MKINWKQKLTSRKFWAAVVTFVTTVLVAFGVPDLTIEQVTAQSEDIDHFRDLTKMEDGGK